MIPGEKKAGGYFLYPPACRSLPGIPSLLASRKGGMCAQSSELEYLAEPTS